MFKLKIREHREVKGISQKELAEQIGMTQAYISELESNSRDKSPTLHTIEKIAEALEVCPLDLLECHCKYCDDDFFRLIVKHH